MKWKPHHMVADKVADERYNTLSTASQQFREALSANEWRQTYDLFLDFLIMYVDAHISIEDDRARVHECPNAALNRHELERLLSLVRKENARFCRHGFDAKSATRLLDELDGWLEGHIRRVDSHVREMMNGTCRRYCIGYAVGTAPC